MSRPSPRAPLWAQSLAFTALGLLSSGCGDPCLAFDYSPPSARLSIVDAASGDALCDPSTDVQASRGEPVLHADTCEWWLADWVDDGVEAAVGSAEITLSLTGFVAQTIMLEVARNGCAEIQRPPLLRVELQRE